MANCQKFQLDGLALRVYVSDSTGDPRADINNLIRELTGEDTPKWFIPRITIDIELALERYRSCLQTPDHSHFSLKDLANIKIPAFPKGKGLDGRLTPDQLKADVQSIRARLNICNALVGWGRAQWHNPN